MMPENYDHAREAKNGPRITVKSDGTYAITPTPFSCMYCENEDAVYGLSNIWYCLAHWREKGPYRDNE